MSGALVKLHLHPVCRRESRHPSGTGLPICAQCTPIEIRPATLKISEKPRKYHFFFPNQSIFYITRKVPRSLYLPWYLSERADAPSHPQFTLQTRQHPANSSDRQLLVPPACDLPCEFEDYPRDKHGCKQISPTETKYKRYGRSPLPGPVPNMNRIAAENNRRDVRVDDRDPCVRETLIDRLRRNPCPATYLLHECARR